jgi:hypothetical protein
VSQPATAATGDVLRELVAPVNGFSASSSGGRGVAFDGAGHLYYTFDGVHSIFEATTAGVFLGSVPDAGGTIQGGPLAWDGSALWTANYVIGNELLYRVDPGTGNVLSSCNYVTQNPSSPAITSTYGLSYPPDGLDWTGSSLWLSSDALPGNYVGELNTSCTILRAFQAQVYPDGLDPPEGHGSSGVAFVDGALWHAYPLAGYPSPTALMVQTDLAGTVLGSFPTRPFLEDLAFDQVTFAPKCALWANESAPSPPSHLTAYEIPCSSVTYTVTFLQPLDQSTDPAMPVKNYGKNGRVIPVKVRITSSNGTPVTDTANPTVTMELSHLTSCASSVSDAIESYAPAGSANSDGVFRWDGTQWAYNWNPSSSHLTTGDCYRINVVLNGDRIASAFAIFQPVK